MQSVRSILAACFLGVSLLASAAHAAVATTPLDQYLDGLKTLRVSFTQSIEDSQGRKTDRSTGALVVSRPGKFRWEIHPAGSSTAAQLLVADGRNLWFFDPDLEQVTVKPMDAALTATPAMLLSGGADVRSAFDISNQAANGGLQWVRVAPKAADADFREALLGFGGGELKRMVLKDKLGQTATLDFDHTQRNAPVKAEEIMFTPPAGADVIGTPSK
jgi:outer membrane lipoprotein carrier protein